MLIRMLKWGGMMVVCMVSAGTQAPSSGLMNVFAEHQALLANDKIFEANELWVRAKTDMGDRLRIAIIAGFYRDMQIDSSSALEYCQHPATRCQLTFNAQMKQAARQVTVTYVPHDGRLLIAQIDAH